MIREEFERKFITVDGKINRNSANELRELIGNKYNSTSLQECAFLFVSNLEHPPVCDCGRKLRFISFTIGYNPACGNCLRKKTNLERYGVETKLTLPETKERIRITNIQRYGADNPAKNQEVKNKARKTCLDRYGSPSPAGNEDVKRKLRKTCLKKYGCENPKQNPKVTEKTKRTNLLRYGVIAPIQNPDIKKKIISTNLERYGEDNPMKSEITKNKMTKTVLAKYGVNSTASHKETRAKMRNSFKRSAFLKKREELKDTHIFLFGENEFIDNTYTYTRFPLECKACGHHYESFLGNGNIPLCPVCNPKLSNSSKAEQEIADFVQSILPSHTVETKNNRFLTGGREIDILVKDKNLAIEYNGIYWHSSKHVDKEYHKRKTDECKELGVRLVHVFEDIWESKQELVKDRIQSILGIYEMRVYARQCVVKEIGPESVEFFKKNHLQGNVINSHCYGLFYKEELISAMSFGRPRFNKEYEWELLRFASKIGISVVGGASRLFSRFLEDIRPNTVLTYSNRVWGDSDFYQFLGFEFLKTTSPGYFYSHSDTNERKHRLQMSKKNQERTMKKFNPELNEEENAYLNGWLKIWDCGQNVWVWKK